MIFGRNKEFRGEIIFSDVNSVRANDVSRFYWNSWKKTVIEFGKFIIFEKNTSGRIEEVLAEISFQWIVPILTL